MKFVDKSKAGSHHFFFSLEYFRSLKKEQWLYLGALASSILFATIISLNYSRDSFAYKQMFDMYGASGWGRLPAEILGREAFFLITSKVFFSFGLSSLFLFFLYAIISLSVKFYLVARCSKDKWLSLAFFASYFFILHDSTQIRFGLAVAFSYFGLYFLSQGKKIVFAVMILLSAFLFHVSSIAFIVMLVFSGKKPLFFLAFLMIFSVLLYPVNLLNALSEPIAGAINYFDIHGTVINKLFWFYFHGEKATGGLGLFTIRMFLVYFCVAVLFQYRKVFSTFEALCYYSLIFSVFFYILMKDFWVVQYRLSGLFGFALVFLVPYIHRWLSGYLGKRSAYALLLLFFMVTLLKFTWYDKMIII